MIRRQQMEQIIALQTEILSLSLPYDIIKRETTPQKKLFCNNIDGFNELKKKEERQFFNVCSTFTTKFSRVVCNFYWYIFSETKVTLYETENNFWNDKTLYEANGFLVIKDCNVIEFYTKTLNKFEKHLENLPYQLLYPLLERNESEFSYSSATSKWETMTLVWLIKNEMLSQYHKKLQELEKLRIEYMFSQCVIETKMLQKHPPLNKEKEVIVSRYKPCTICSENEANICFIPCGHVLLCKGCSKTIEQCPLCAKEIISLTKIYL